MNRRELLGSALAMLCATPRVVALSERNARIGWLELNASADNLGIFEQAMARRGWTRGTTFSLEYRSGEGKPERLASVCADLVRLPVDVIVAPGAAEVLAAKSATKSIPIVMARVDEPVARGLFGSFAQPGRNVTGVASARRELNARLLSLVHELAPRVSRVAVLWDSTDAGHRDTLADLRVAARKVNVSLNAVDVQQYTDVEPAFATIKRQGNKVLVVPWSSMLVPRWIADLALTHGLALASTSPGYVYDGGLIACTDDWNAVFDRVAAFVDKILKGARPTELPVEVSAKFKLIVNAKTARTLKLAIPQSILVHADAVID